MTDAIPLITLSDADQEARPERADAAANRQLVLATAERLFEQQGVAAVTMADIAQAAGIGKGTLYRRYANKAELCLALMDEQMAEFQNGMLADMARMNAEGAPYVAQLKYYLARLVVFADRHAPLLCEVERSGLLLESTHPELPHFWHATTIAAMLRAGQRQGEIAAGLDADYFAETLLTAAHVDTLRYQREVRGFSNERIVSGLQALVDALAV